MKDRVRIIFNGKLNLLRSCISAQKRYQHKGGIQPCRDSSGADNVAVYYYSCIRQNCAVIHHQVTSAPMSRYVSSRENVGRTTQQRSGAYREEELFVLNVPANEPEYLFVVHKCLLSITTRNEQNIEDSCFRDAHIRSEPKPLYVANRLEFFPDDLNCSVRHAGKNFKWSREVNLIHPLEDEAAHGKWPRRQVWLGSFTDK